MLLSLILNLSLSSEIEPWVFKTRVRIQGAGCLDNCFSFIVATYFNDHVFRSKVSVLQSYRLNKIKFEYQYDSKLFNYTSGSGRSIASVSR